MDPGNLELRNWLFSSFGGLLSRHCYAAKMTKHQEAMGNPKYQGLYGKGHFNGVVKCHEDALTIPLKWRKPRRIFVNSMSDLFHEGVPDDFIAKVFAVMMLGSFFWDHVFQALTKRPERMARLMQSSVFAGMVIAARSELAKKSPENAMMTFTQNVAADTLADLWPPKGVWLGTSVEDQNTANERIPHLLRCPAAVRFLSCEPLLGPINLLDAVPCGYYCDESVGHVDHSLNGIHWCVGGGESGPGARPCDIEWIRSIVAQCRDANVAVFVKQLGKCPIGADVKHSKGGDPEEWPEDLRVREFPRVGAA